MESEGSHKVLGYSTYSSSLPTYHQHQHQHQHSCTESLYLDVHQSEGKAAAIHDFFSLCGIGNTTSIVTEMSATTGDSSLRLEGKTHDSKGIALRSKHSATEQRRRSKINERSSYSDIVVCQLWVWITFLKMCWDLFRFQTLKQLLPNIDQKKDKASVLLEAIEYIQILQEKLKCFEASEQERQQEHMNSRQLDGNAGLEGPTEKSSNASSPSIAALERKGLPEANGHTRSRSGSLSTVCENGTLGSNFGANRLSEGTQACQSNHNGKLAGSQPVSPAFLTHPVIESTSASTMHSTRRTPLQACGKPSHLSNEEQVTLAAYNTPRQAEIIGFSQSLQPQGSNTKLDWDNEKVRIPSCTLESVGNRDHSKDVEYTKTTCNPNLQQLGGAHVQDSEIYNDRCVDAQKEKQVKEMTTDALETHCCHGVSISPSKFYSQRLQERIRLALHNSGIDVNHTRISVQLQLEETCKAILSESGMIDPSNPGQSQELDHIRKRSKVDTIIND